MKRSESTGVSRSVPGARDEVVLGPTAAGLARNGRTVLVEEYGSAEQDRFRATAPGDRAPGGLKVLISAYSCVPNSGSEPGIGWNTAREMAKHYQVWVLTRVGDGLGRDQRAAIEAYLRENPVPNLHFLYYDLPGWVRRLFGIQVSSYLWQLAAYRVALRAHREIGFDLAHHVSWVRYYTPSLLALLPTPFVWGPVGGADAMPRSFRRQLGWGSRIMEFQRRVVQKMAEYDPLVRLTARRSAVILANSNETAQRIAALGAHNVRVYGESGVDSWVLETGAKPPPKLEGPVRFASMTRLLYWKGVHLGLYAFAALGPVDAVYSVIGEGPEKPRLQALAKRLGIADRVEFHSNLSRQEWMDRLRQCDALVHPCIYNSGSAISLEAMSMQRPVICLDRGAIRDQVRDDIGFKIPAESPEEAIAGIRDAMAAIIADREMAAAKGRLAREHVQRNFSWTARANMLNRVYADALATAAGRAEASTEP